MQANLEAGNDGFDYARLSDEEAEQARADMIKTKGFFILLSELFCNVKARAEKDENLNMTLEAAFRHIEESAKGSASEDNFAGLFDDIDVNSNKLGATVAKRNANLVKLSLSLLESTKAQHLDLNVNLDALEAEYSKLQSDHAALARQLEQVQAEL